ncbi:MAG TPA: polysaccharide biosynthesis/export family protein [Bryobacteraceae bacterium]
MISSARVVAFSAILAVALPIAAQKARVAKVPDDLAEYVQLARSLGLTNEELRLNAIKNGYKPNLVDEALKNIPVPSPSEKKEEDRGVSDAYVIGEADVLGVVVYKEAEASVPSIIVRADGKIGLPLIKDVSVSGISCPEAEALIIKKLKDGGFYTDPDVSVYVREVHSKFYYLVGAFKKQGPVELKRPTRVLEAVIEAGGPTEFAKQKRMWVLRTEKGSQFRIEFNYKDLLAGQHPETNIWVRPGDTVYAEQ